MTEQGIFPDIGFDHIAQFINPEGIKHNWYQLVSQSGEIVIDPAGMPKNEELFRRLGAEQRANPAILPQSQEFNPNCKSSH